MAARYISWRHLPLVALDFNHFVYSVHEQSDEFVPILDDEDPAISTRNGLREPEAHSKVEYCHDFAAEVDNPGNFLGGVAYNSQGSNSDHLLDSSRVQSVNRVADEECRQQHCLPGRGCRCLEHGNFALSRIGT